MKQCSECGQDIDRRLHEPGVDSIPVCFSCYLEGAEYVRHISVGEEDGEHILYIQSDYEDENWGCTYSFDTQREAMGCGKILAEKICVVLIIELSFDDNYVFVGTRSTEEAESLLQLVQDDPLSVWVRDTQIVDLAQCYVSGEPRRYDGEPLLSRFVCWRMAMWRACNYPYRIRPLGLRPPPQDRIEIHGIPCVFNSRRGLSEQVAEQIQTKLVETFVDIGGFEAVETLGDIGDAAGEEMEFSSWLFPDLRYRLQEYARENKEVLSPRSRKGMERNEAGKQFEGTFREVCDDYGLEYWSGDKLFSVRYQLHNLREGRPDYIDPERYEQRLEQLEAQYSKTPVEARAIADKVETGSGFPDYVVWGDVDDLDSFVQECSEGLERKKDVLLVEVKFRSDPDDTAYFTDDQKERIPELQNSDADVYVFRGTPDDHWLKRPSV